MTEDYIDIADAGDSVRLPLVDILTGRGFVTGKSGSGKSNSVNVIVEELLDRNQPLLIVDTDGEYWGLKEQYQVLHLGNGEQCDVRVTATDAETIVDLALVERVPIILDVSGFLHKEDAQEITHRVVRELFHREKTLKEPFLLIAEEVHEYIPESGGLTDVGRMLIQVAKRGRKHGLGFVGVSQRPASVDKDFITQCDWIVWHRLTWKNDTDVVSTILGSDAADTVEELDPGGALLMSDWDEQVRQVQVRRKRTFDAGATPGFDDFEPPELVPVNPAILNRFDERRQNVDYADLGDDGDGAEAGGPDADVDAPLDPSSAQPDSSESEDEGEDEGDDSGAADEDVTAEAVPTDETGGEAEAAEPMSGEGAGDAAESADAVEADASADAETGPEPVADANAESSVATAAEDRPATAEAERADPDRPPLGEEPLEAEIVASRPDGDAPTPRNGVGGASRRAGRPRSAAAQPTTGDGVLVEFTELLLFLAAWIRTTVEDAVVGAVRRIGRVADWVAGAWATVRRKTRLADEDLLVAMWLALVIAFVLLLSVVLVVAL